MKNYIIAIVVGLLCNASLLAQKNKKEADKEAIKSMCGCYEVIFNFAETFAPDKDYEFHDNYTSGGLEWVEAIEETGDKLVLQHLLIVPGNMIVKHWRQDWLYENTELFTFDKERTWNLTNLPRKEVAGQWTQKVFQVDDSPRYEASASWVHSDGRSYWEAVASAPLPRREYTKRHDYNVMLRRNRHEITAYGWVHEQDNDKVIRAEKDVTLAQEKGFNTYKKTDNEKCKAAQEWWANNQQFWKDVRSVWDNVFDENKTVTLRKKSDDKFLHEHLFALGKKWEKAENYNAQTVRSEIEKIINAFLVKKNDASNY